MTQNPYAPPLAAPVEPVADTSVEAGSIEAALAGRYEVDIIGIVKESWALLPGIKGKCWIAFLVIMALTLGAQLALTAIVDPNAYMMRGQVMTGMALSFAQGIVMGPLTMPLYAGLFVLMIRHVARVESGIGDLFSQFGKVLPLFAMMLISSVLIYLGFLLLVLPGIFLSVAVGFAMPLLVDADLGPWEAIKVSIRATRHHWFRIFGLVLVMSGIVFLGTIPLGLGSIWTLPWFMVAFTVTYRRIFGFHSV